MVPIFTCRVLHLVPKAKIINMDNEETQVNEKVNETQVVEPSQTYHLHVRLNKDLQGVLNDSAELACKPGDIPRPDLVALINLFIGWGLSIQSTVNAKHGQPLTREGRGQVHDKASPQGHLRNSQN